ncbi:MAG: hemolysin III family protein [Victivallaceae bacterium]|nr:hemolysin III family protein [Victivallaceae bacterium]
MNTEQREDKSYSPAEDAVNFATHAIGAALAVIVGICFAKHYAVGDLALRIGYLAYVVTLAGMFSTSASYHAAKNPDVRRTLRKLDHSMIYFLIAGTHTPVFLGPLRGGLCGWLLAGLWICAAAGTVCKFLLSQKYHWIDVVLYLVCGWCSLAVLGRMYEQLPSPSFALLIAGGAAYTLGVPIYLLRVPFAHAAWHVVVMLAAALQFASVIAMGPA